MVQLLRTAEGDQVIKQLILSLIIQEKILFPDIVNPRLRIDDLKRKGMKELVSGYKDW